MKSKIFVWPAILLASWMVSLAPAGAAEPAARVREIQNFDHDWKFFKGEVKGAETNTFDDSAWRTLDVPHDWSIEGPFAETNRTGGAGGFLPSGVGWYRKYFSLPVTSDRQHVFIEFDGVMANSEVWINGFRLGKRPFGYVSFGYNLTGHLNFGSKSNLLVVRADTSGQPASRWYSGAGIYRHVRLIVTSPTRVEPWGTFVSTPTINADGATVRVQNVVTNGDHVGREVSLQITLTDSAGKVVQTAETPAQVIGNGKTGKFSQELTLKEFHRWNPEHPEMYQAKVAVRFNNKTFDDDVVPFGIREFHFDPWTGFWMNGKNFKLYGVCLHHDASAFGAAVPLRAWERRLQELQQLGVNAIRTAHNPPAPEFLDLCDRMGMVVMDEFFDCWTVGKTRYDYHLDFNEWSKVDARDTIKRDRNHPSIVLYSVGNEIHDTPKAELAKGILKGLVEVCHENDPTRPVTQALFRPNVSGDYTNGLADLLDVVGTNYRDTELLAAQRAKPDRKIVGTEQRHERATWLNLRDNPSHSGQFLWSGIDYLGESRRWPVIAAGSGLLDRTGTPKPMAFERQSWWLDKPMVYITRRVVREESDGQADPGFAPLDRRPGLFADWSPSEPRVSENVEVYSNCEEVELQLNGKTLGTKPLPPDASARNWDVKYAPGTLRAIGRNKGKVVIRQELHTAGKPAKILLKADREKLTPTWDDVSFVTVTIVDEDGVTIPNAQDLVTFKVTGPGVIAAVDSADNSCHDAFQASERRAYQGRCFAIVRSTASSGRIRLTATAAGLPEATLSLRAIEAGE